MKYTVSIKENRQFRRLYAKGKSVLAPCLVLYYRKTGGQENRLGITVSGKLGNAVTRNKIRRRLHEIYRTQEAQFLPGSSIVMVARARAVTTSYRDLQKTVLTLSGKAGLLRSSAEKLP